MPDEMHDELIARVAAELRRPVPVSADLDARVMARVRAGRRRGLGGAWDWLRRPRTVSVSPLGALALAAGLALVVVARDTLVRGGRAASPAPAALAAAPGSAVPEAPAMPVAASPGGVALVQFVLVAPRARTVAVAGDFNGWDTHRTVMRRVSSTGLWEVEVPLRPGRYTYTFVVDGTRWLADPAAPRAIADDFGAPSSVLTVTRGEGGRT